MADLGTGALLHDIGKLALPDRVRLPHDDFSSAETSLYRDHVGHGISQARRMGLTPGALLAVAQHHELADGSGFPKGVTGERMSMGARILSLVNHYDNLCNAASPAKPICWAISKYIDDTPIYKSTSGVSVKPTPNTG